MNRGVAGALFALCLLTTAAAQGAGQPMRVGSKAFAESHVLAEIVAQYLEARGFQVERHLGLGGTLVAFGALEAGDIDLYPEYTGTLKQVILGEPHLSSTDLAGALERRGLRQAVRFGFNNSYAIAVDLETAQQLAIETIGDLAGHPQLRAAFSHEFLKRADGWEALSKAYALPQDPVGIEHALAYSAIENDKLDLTDAYTTDGELAVRQLRLLQDNLDFFPDYSATLLASARLPDPVYLALAELEDKLDAASMRDLNYQVSSLQRPAAQVAAGFLAAKGLVATVAAPVTTRSGRITTNVIVHLKLTAAALLGACLIALPASLLASAHPRAARTLLYITGLVQTIPALALLALLIPLLGLGELPAITALCLYSLLPIIRNTLVGLFSIDPLIKEVAEGMGLTDRQRLYRIEIPLAAPAILAGIKTAAIISIGTATLAAFVGAGGLGEPIITGLTLNDHRLILEGAIPAALLALAVELGFEILERVLVPAHLRK